MAAGDRKVKVIKTKILRGNPVRYEADWELFVENKVGVDCLTANGTSFGSFGTPAAWRVMTGLQMENQVNADVAANAAVPPRDSVS